MSDFKVKQKQKRTTTKNPNSKIDTGRIQQIEGYGRTLPFVSLASPSYLGELHLLLIVDTQVVLIVSHQNQLKVLNKEVVNRTRTQRQLNRWGDSGQHKI